MKKTVTHTAAQSRVLLRRANKKAHLTIPEQMTFEEAQAFLMVALLRVINHPEASHELVSFFQHWINVILRKSGVEACTKSRPALDAMHTYRLLPGQLPGNFCAADGSLCVPSKLREIGWNERVLTFDDFERIVKRVGLAFTPAALRNAAGQYSRNQGKHIILLEQDLCGADRAEVAWHEFGHYLLHTPGATDGNQAELEADLVAACALIPQHLVTAHSTTEIVRQFGYDPCLVRRRIRMFRCFNL